MSKQYKVIAGAFPYTERNKCYNSQDIVNEEDLVEGDGDKYVKEGFLEEIKSEEPDTQATGKKAKGK